MMMLITIFIAATLLFVNSFVQQRKLEEKEMPCFILQDL